VVITYHIPTEFERFQARIGRLSLQDVADLLASNQTREAYGSTEGSIVLTIPKKITQRVN
jgi:acyl-CoA synthetase (AMP-forming)/AMP-acid ligase II